MILKNLHLKNFRRFETLDIGFDEKLTVIVAHNGQGKTSILEAIIAGLGPFVGAFDNGRSPHIDAQDARYAVTGPHGQNEQQFPVEISGEIRLESQPVHWKRERAGVKGRSTVKDAVNLKNYGKELQSRLRTDEGAILPLIAYYSSERLWKSRQLSSASKKSLTGSRTLGYADCLGRSSTFKQMEQWLHDATLTVLQDRQEPEFTQTRLEAQLQGIQHAVNSIVRTEGWGYFRYSMKHRSLTLRHDDHGELPLSLLSDGLRATVTLAADMAFRCAHLNPALGIEASQRTSGIVMIDEIGLHLHPGWQQRILISLQEAFPSIQFVVTTHSPQILSSVPSASVRVIQRDETSDTPAFQVVTPTVEIEGRSSDHALLEAFGVDPLPPSEWSERYNELLNLPESNVARFQTLRNELAEHFGEDHVWVQEADRIQRLRAMRTRLKAQQAAHTHHA